jgi:ATP-dependent protease HslVU (ClpYQ) ATPase subunit
MTKHGPVKTDFCCLSPPERSMGETSRPDSELQGRFPIRVELESLTRDDFGKF